MTDDLRLLLSVEDSLCKVETQINLLARLSSGGATVSLAGELQGLLESPAIEPRRLLIFRDWRRPSDGSQLSAILSACRLGLRSLGAELRARLLEARIDELELELAIARAPAGDTARKLSSERYRVSPDALEASSTLARDWLQHDIETTSDSSVDLAGELVRLCRDAAFEFPVRSVELAAQAAVSGDSILVRRGARATRSEARRVFIHEVEGHLLPRMRAARERCPPGRIGTAESDMDEEGRAVYLEETQGLLSSKRRRELACRHLLAERVRTAGALEACAAAIELVGDVGPVLVASALARVLRGGGLAREIIYLPGLLRIRRAAECPPVMDFLARGRYSVASARRLLELSPLATPRPSGA